MANGDDEIDNDLPDEIISHLEAFYRSMNAAEESLEPILSMSCENLHEKVCPKFCFENVQHGNGF